MLLSYFWLLSSFGKRRGPSFGQMSIRITKGCFVPSFIEIDPVILEKKSFKSCQFHIGSLEDRTKLYKVFAKDLENRHFEEKSSHEPLTQVS